MGKTSAQEIVKLLKHIFFQIRSMDFCLVNVCTNRPSGHRSIHRFLSWHLKYQDLIVMNFDDVGCNIKPEKMVPWLSHYYSRVAYSIWDADEESYISHSLGIIIPRPILLSRTHQRVVIPGILNGSCWSMPSRVSHLILELHPHL